MTFFPQLISGHASEDEASVSKSRQLIQRSYDCAVLTKQISTAMSVMGYCAQINLDPADRRHAIQTIGSLGLGHSASALNLLMSGYCKSSFFLQREVLRLAFLLDLLTTSEKTLGDWISCDERGRAKKFVADKIIDALDRRDGATEGERSEHFMFLDMRANSLCLDDQRVALESAIRHTSAKDALDDGLLRSGLSELACVNIMLAEYLCRVFGGNLALNSVLRSEFETARAPWAKYLNNLAHGNKKTSEDEDEESRQGRRAALRKFSVIS
jgi:hypothetical protein